MKTLKDLKRELMKRHPEYGLKDQVAGRCPYCLASAEIDCDCEKQPKPVKTHCDKCLEWYPADKLEHGCKDQPKEAGDWEREFEEKVNELRCILPEDNEGKGQVVSFGYKVKRVDEVFTIVDFGNIKSFIRILLKPEREKEYKEGVKDGESTKNGVKRYLMGYADAVRECVEVVSKLGIGKECPGNLPGKPCCESCIEQGLPTYNQALEDIKLELQDLLIREKKTKE